MRPNNRWANRAICAVLGAAMATGHAPFDLWPVALVAATLVFGRLNFSHGFWTGWFVGLGYFAVALHWIVEPFLVDFQRHGWMAPFALVFLSGGLALFWGVAFWAARSLSGQSHTLVLPFTWALSEFARASILTGFPWAMPSYIWVETPIAQLAAFIGPHALITLTLLFAAFAAILWQRRKSFVVAPILVFAAAWVVMSARIPDVASTTDVTVRLVQPNAPQHLKWRPDMLQTFFDRQLSASAAPGNPDLIVWPEAAVPYVLGERPDLDQTIASAAVGDAQIILGIRSLADVDGVASWRNSLQALGPDGSITTRYDKHHLVPFGEYLPFPGLVASLGLTPIAANAGQYTAGMGPQTLSLPDLPAFQPLICYEAIFPAEIQRGADRPAWLLHITNDAWFGNFSGPYQHLDQSRFRAIEQGLPLARSANTGVSAVIDPFGRITARIPLNTDGFVDAALPKPLQPTLYATTGDLPWLALTVIAGLGAVVFSRRVRALKPINR